MLPTMGVSKGIRMITSAEIAEMVDRHPYIRSSIAMGDRLKTLVPKSVGAAAHYIVTQEVDRKSPGYRPRADEFFEGLATGLNLSDVDPRWWARRRLVDLHKNKKLRSVNAQYLEVIIHSWNMFRFHRPQRRGITITGEIPDVKA